MAFRYLVLFLVLFSFLGVDKGCGRALFLFRRLYLPLSIGTSSHTFWAWDTAQDALRLGFLLGHRRGLPKGKEAQGFQDQFPALS